MMVENTYKQIAVLFAFPVFFLSPLPYFCNWLKTIKPNFILSLEIKHSLVTPSVANQSKMKLTLVVK